MDKLRPYLKKLQRNLDPVAFVVIAILVALAYFTVQGERTSAPDEPPSPISPTPIGDQVPFPDATYSQVVNTLSGDGGLYTPRNSGEGVSATDAQILRDEILRSNPFIERNVQEIDPADEAENLVEDAEALRAQVVQIVTEGDVNDPVQRENLINVLEEQRRVLRDATIRYSGFLSESSAERAAELLEENTGNIAAFGGGGTP